MEELLVLIVRLAGKVDAELAEHAHVHVGQDNAGVYLRAL